MDTKEFKEFNKKIRSKGLVISRIPEKTRDLFVEISNNDFCGDYGLFLKWCLDEALEFQTMKQMFGENLNLKLDSIIDLVDNSEIKQEEEEKPQGKRMLSGRTV